MICIGDLNCDIINPLHNNQQGKCLLDICDIYDLNSLITSPTRISTNRTSCLDFILTNVPAFIKDSGVIETGLSDHCLVYAALNTKLMRPKADKITRRSFKNFDQKAFLRDLNTVPFSVAYTFGDTNDVYWCWEQLYNQVLDDHAPITTTKKRQTTGSKFITPDIRKSMRERDRLKKKSNKSRNHEDWEKYRLIRNKIVSMRRKAMQDYFQRLCVDRYADQRKFWSTIKPYIKKRKSKQNGRIVLKDNERIIRDKREVAEILNNFFTSFGNTEQSISGVKPTPNLSHIQQNFIPKHPLSLKKTSPVEVKEAMLKVKTNKATGYDNLPPRAIKESAEILCYPFSVLFNHILENSRIPQHWKLGEVSPVFKKDCCLTKSKLQTNNYTTVLVENLRNANSLQNQSLFR